MYAKLVFPETTKPIEICRDVVNCIVSSNGSGGSTVGGLEFVEAATSQIIDTEASGWSLRSGYTLGTGAADVNDVLYDLQTNHAQSGKKITARIEIVGDRTDATVYENTASGIVMVPVLDADTSEEIVFTGYTGSVDTGYRKSAMNKEIHIFASTKRLIIIGKPAYNTTSTVYYSASGHLMYGILESATNNRTEYENMAPYMYVRDICGSGNSVVSPETNGLGYVGTLGEVSTTYNTLYYSTQPYVSMIDAVYNADLGFKYRALSMYGSTSMDDTITYSHANLWTMRKGIVENGTPEGSVVTLTTTDAAGVDWCGSVLPCYNPGLSGQSRNQAINPSTGVSILKVFPIWWRCEHNIAEILDFSATGVYHTYGGQGTFGDTLVINGDDYFYADTIVRGAWAIKKA